MADQVSIAAGGVGACAVNLAQELKVQISSIFPITGGTDAVVLEAVEATLYPS
jgi:hypothetical protein